MNKTPNLLQVKIFFYFAPFTCFVMPSSTLKTIFHQITKVINELIRLISKHWLFICEFVVRLSSDIIFTGKCIGPFGHVKRHNIMILHHRVSVHYFITRGTDDTIVSFHVLLQFVTLKQPLFTAFDPRRNLRQR